MKNFYYDKKIGCVFLDIEIRHKNYIYREIFNLRTVYNIPQKLPSGHKTGKQTKKFIVTLKNSENNRQ